MVRSQSLECVPEECLSLGEVDHTFKRSMTINGRPPEAPKLLFVCFIYFFF